jgi:retron-type reverse transcriptase
MEEVVSEVSLRSALQMELQRKGPAGIDRQTVEEFAGNADRELSRLRKELLSGRYRPLPLVRFEKRKKKGGFRTLGISAVRDRVVQRAILEVLTPVFEQRFLDCSHQCFRRGDPGVQAGVSTPYSFLFSLCDTK